MGRRKLRCFHWRDVFVGFLIAVEQGIVRARFQAGDVAVEKEVLHLALERARYRNPVDDRRMRRNAFGKVGQAPARTSQGQAMRDSKLQGRIVVQIEVEFSKRRDARHYGAQAFLYDVEGAER